MKMLILGAMGRVSVTSGILGMTQSNSYLFVIQNSAWVSLVLIFGIFQWYRIYLLKLGTCEVAYV